MEDTGSRWEGSERERRAKRDVPFETEKRGETYPFLFEPLELTIITFRH